MVIRSEFHRKSTAAELRARRAHTSVPSLIEQSTHGSLGKRYFAVTSLGLLSRDRPADYRRHQAPVLRALTRALSDPDSLTREQAASGLNRTRPPRSMRVLDKMLDDSYFVVKLRALDMLGKTRSVHALPIIAKALRLPQGPIVNNSEVISGALGALVRLGHPGGIALAREALNGYDYVQHPALQTLDALATRLLQNPRTAKHSHALALCAVMKAARRSTKGDVTEDPQRLGRALDFALAQATHGKPPTIQSARLLFKQLQNANLPGK